MVRVNASFRFCANRRRDTVGQFEHCTVSPQDLDGCPCVCARVKTLLSITVTTQISSCVYSVPPFSFVAHYAPVNGVHVRVRDSNRHTPTIVDTSPLFELSMARTRGEPTRGGRNESFHDNGNLAPCCT